MARRHGRPTAHGIVTVPAKRGTARHGAAQQGCEHILACARTHTRACTQWRIMKHARMRPIHLKLIQLVYIREYVRLEYVRLLRNTTMIRRNVTYKPTNNTQINATQHTTSSNTQIIKTQHKSIKLIN